MIKRAIICGYVNFPRGSASANYIQYLSAALIDNGYEVIIISDINKSELEKKSFFMKKYKEKLHLDPIELDSGTWKHFLEFNFMMGIIVQKKIEKYKLNSSDVLISYSSDPFLNHTLIKLSKKYKAKSCACIAEWFSYHEFHHYIVNIAFYRYWINFHYEFPRFQYLFPISTYIEDYYKKKGCNTFCLPIMADAYEYEYEYKKPINSTRRKIIYPSNGMIKDSVKSIFKAFDSLTAEEINKIELHICGMKEEQIIALLSEKNKNCIGKNIEVHKWMSYSELVELYKQMDFLLIPREANQMNRANFPSKVPETMCYGVIPVVSKVGDYTEYYLKNEENSFVFEGATPAACASALRRCVNCSDERLQKLSMKARAAAIEKFDYRNWNKKIEGFLMK